MSNQASETIQGSYTVTTMPDGQTVLMQKLSDGKWVRVEERLAEPSLSDRFKGTQTVPNDWTEPKSSNLVRNKGNKNIENLIKVSSTHRHLHAHLIEILGSPTEIIKNKKLNKEIKDPSIHRMVDKMLESLGEYTPWNEVREIFKNGWKGY
jgi:hypothetical protein